MILLHRLLAIIADRALALLTLLALVLLGVGISAKMDVWTAAIVVGAIILIDLEVSSLRGAPK